jgi:glycosyltransferase involved in cell wall biosynthesis
MKILHVIDSLGLGGAQVLVRSIVEQSSPLDEHHVYSLRTVCPTIESSSGFLFQFQSKSKFSLFPIPNLINHVNKRKIEVLHVHLWRSLIFTMIAKPFFRSHVRAIYHEHGQICGNVSSSRIIGWLYRATIKLASNQGFDFIAISDHVGKLLTQSISTTDAPVTRIKLLKNFPADIVNKDNVPGSVVPPRHKDSGYFTLGFAGRITSIKGWREFISLAILLRHDTGARFLIAGTGEDQEELVSIIEREMLENLHYLGFVIDMHSDFYSKIDCLIVPSHNEPLGLTPLEAFRAGVPVIASNVPGLNEIVRHEQTGLLFTAHSVQDLLSSVNRIRATPNLVEMLVQNANNELSLYSASKYMSQLQLLYRGVMS